MTAVFWIETVEEVIEVPPLKVGQQFAVKGRQRVAGQRAPTFSA